LDPRTLLVQDVDYSNFAQAVNAFGYVEAEGILAGSQTAGAIAVFVPRELWMSKPFDSGRVVSGAPLLNFTVPLHAELYLDFGWAGIILGAALLGLVARRLDRFCETRFIAGEGMPLPLVLAVSFFPLVLRGSLQAVVATLLPLAILAFVSAWVGRETANDQGIGCPGD
jgi:hypothetical protein